MAGTRQTTLKGGKFMLWLKDSGTQTTIPLSTSAKLSLGSSISDEATKDDGELEYNEVTTRNWSVTNDSKLVDGVSVAMVRATLFTAWQQGTEVEIILGIPANYNADGITAITGNAWTVPTGDYYSGKILIESMDITGDKGSAGTLSLSGKGQGKLTYTA